MTTLALWKPKDCIRAGEYRTVWERIDTKMAKVGHLTIEMEGEPAKTFTIGEGSLTPEKIVEYSFVTDQNGEEAQRLNLLQAKAFLKDFHGGQANGCQLIITEE